MLAAIRRIATPKADKKIAGGKVLRILIPTHLLHEFHRLSLPAFAGSPYCANLFSYHIFCGRPSTNWRQKMEQAVLKFEIGQVIFKQCLIVAHICQRRN